MKNGKEITATKLTIDYIISFILWGFVFSLVLEPILEVLFTNIIEKIFEIDLEYTFFITPGVLICIVISGIIISTLITVLVNIISTSSSLKKIENLDNQKATQYLKNITIFIVVSQIIMEILNYFVLNNRELYTYIAANISLIISVIFIRMYIKKRIKILINK